MAASSNEMNERQSSFWYQERLLTCIDSSNDLEVPLDSMNCTLSRARIRTCISDDKQLG